MCFWLNAGYWKLVPGYFMILLKENYSEIWSFLIAEFYQSLNVPYSAFQKNATTQLVIEKLEQVVKLKRIWNLDPIFQMVLKIPENYCPCFYL